MVSMCNILTLLVKSLMDPIVHTHSAVHPCYVCTLYTCIEIVIFLIPPFIVQTAFFCASYHCSCTVFLFLKEQDNPVVETDVSVLGQV